MRDVYEICDFFGVVFFCLFSRDDGDFFLVLTFFVGLVVSVRNFFLFCHFLSL